MQGSLRRRWLAWAPREGSEGKGIHRKADREQRAREESAHPILATRLARAEVTTFLMKLVGALAVAVPCAVGRVARTV